MLFGIFNCDDFGSFCAYSMGDDIAEILEHLAEQAGYNNVGPTDVQWFRGVERKLKPVRYEFEA